MEPPPSQLPTTEPLLGEAASPRAGRTGKGNGEATAMVNLVNTIVGAGIVSLPHACALTGLAPFAALVAFAQVLTNTSIQWVCRAADAARTRTLYDTTRVLLGKSAETLLRLTVLMNNYGLLIVYLVVAGDVTCGQAGQQGLFELWLPTACGGDSPGVLCRREGFTTLLATCVLLPLCFLDNIKSLAVCSALAVACTLVFVTVTLYLGGYQLATHGLPGIGALGPDPHSFPGPPFLGGVQALVAAVPALVTAFVCHYNVLPIRASLEGIAGPRRDARVFGRSLAFVAILYVLVAASALVYFGSSVSSDVLDEFVFDKLRSAFKFHWLSVTISDIVRLGYAVSLTLTYPLIFMEMRMSTEGLLGQLFRVRFVEDETCLTWAEFARRRLLTTALILSHVVLAVVIADLWVIIHYIGSTGAIAIGFLFPSALHIATNREGASAGLPGANSAVWKARAMFVFSFAIMIFSVLQKG